MARKNKNATGPVPPATPNLPAVVAGSAPSLPASMADAAYLETLRADAGLGLETMANEDKAIPFIGVVQSLSPVRQKNDPGFIPGAEEGDIYNTVTRDLFKADAGLLVIPVLFMKRYLVWVPRSEGGGFIGAYATREETGAAYDKATNKWLTPDGNEVSDTAEHYVLAQCADGTWAPALLSMTSTKLKVSRQWNTRMSMVRIPGTQVTPATFAKVYRLGTVSQQNDKGVFYNYTISDVPGFVEPELYAMAKAFRATLMAGAVKADYTRAPDGPAVPGGETPDIPGATF